MHDKDRLDNQQKAKELILYLASKCEQDPAFGAVKLNKLMFYADFMAYLKFRRPITGQVYVAREFGPAPKELLKLRQDLEKEGALAIIERNFLGYTQQRPIALRAADLSVFSSEEVALIDRVIDLFQGFNASQLSALSHQFDGWRLAARDEVIPYEVALLADRELTLAEREHARSLSDRAAALRRRASGPCQGIGK